MCKDFVLNADHSVCLRNNWKFLKDYLEVRTGGLLDELYSTDVINLEEFEMLRAGDKTQSQQVERLLLIMMRSSDVQYNKFLQAIKPMQAFIYAQLTNGIFL